jgi:hypothetical protein
MRFIRWRCNRHFEVSPICDKMRAISSLRFLGLTGGTVRAPAQFPGRRMRLD